MREARPRPSHEWGARQRPAAAGRAASRVSAHCPQSVERRVSPSAPLHRRPPLTFNQASRPRRAVAFPSWAFQRTGARSRPMGRPPGPTACAAPPPKPKPAPIEPICPGKLWGPPNSLFPVTPRQTRPRPARARPAPSSRARPPRAGPPQRPPGGPGGGGGGPRAPPPAHPRPPPRARPPLCRIANPPLLAPRFCLGKLLKAKRLESTPVYREGGAPPLGGLCVSMRDGRRSRGGRKWRPQNSGGGGERQAREARERKPTGARRGSSSAVGGLARARSAGGRRGALLRGAEQLRHLLQHLHDLGGGRGVAWF
jgi:hypothetical protein